MDLQLVMMFLQVQHGVMPWQELQGLGALN